MKVIVADKISERGVELLRSAGWNIVLTTKDNLNAEIVDADALVVRSATKVTPELLEKAPRLRVVGRDCRDGKTGAGSMWAPVPRPLITEVLSIMTRSVTPPKKRSAEVRKTLASNRVKRT